MCVSTRGRNQFPSVLLQPLGHLSVFRINELQTAQNRLSHTPTTLPALTSITFVFSGLKRTEDEHRKESCKTSESPLITYRRYSEVDGPEQRNDRIRGYVKAQRCRPETRSDTVASGTCRDAKDIDTLIS